MKHAALESGIMHQSGGDPMEQGTQRCPRCGLELWSAGDIIAAFDIRSRATLTHWRRDPTFPEPAFRLSSGPVWVANDVRDWRRRTVANRRRA